MSGRGETAGWRMESTGDRRRVSPEPGDGGGLVARCTAEMVERVQGNWRRRCLDRVFGTCKCTTLNGPEVRYKGCARINKAHVLFMLMEKMGTHFHEGE